MNCGCNQVTSEAYEFPIEDNSIEVFDSLSGLPNKSNKSWCLKQKIILDYLEIINKLECGIQPDLENIIEEISLIDIELGISENLIIYNINYKQ